MNGSSGMVSLATLLILFFISAVVIAAGLFILTAVSPVLKYAQKVERKSHMQEILAEIITAMNSDKTPEADSLFDAWHSEIETLAGENSCKIAVLPVSDAINPNFATQEFLSSDYILSAIKANGNQMANIKQYRADHFISTDLQKHYEAFFPEEILSDESLFMYLSPYGYANINNCDITIADTLLNKWSDTGCREYLNGLRQEEKTIASIKDAMQSLGIDDAGIITTASQYNVNYMPPDQLLGVLEYFEGFKNKDRAIANAKGIHQLIVNAREHGEITPVQLQQILAVPAQPHPVFSYLGTITWFYKVTVSIDEISMVSILCKVPAEENPLYGDLNMNSEFFTSVPEEANEPLEIKAADIGEQSYRVISVRYSYE